MKHAAADIFLPLTEPAPVRSAHYPGKRALDLVLAVAILPAALPLIALLWLLVRLDGGPGFFAHARVGRHGVPFRCWKLRSMVPGAEAKLSAHLAASPEAAQEWARCRKLSCDPRVTRIGRFLRRTSLDELPQVWNVLAGEMSFVGPRPITAGEMYLYAGREFAYLPLRPGLTGLWQVRGRRGADYAERVRMDIDYLRRAAPLYDLRLILATALAVLRLTGR